MSSMGVMLAAAILAAAGPPPVDDSASAPASSAPESPADAASDSDTPSGPVVVGHRAMGSTSGPTYFSENSKTAIAVAIQHLPAIEIDVRITEDQQAVIVHDALVQGRIWNDASKCEAWGRRIENVTLSQLRECTFHNGDAVLELGEFLALLRNTPEAAASEVFFDLKLPTDDSREALPDVVARIDDDLDPRFTPVFQARSKSAAQVLLSLRDAGVDFPSQAKIFVLSNVALSGKKWKRAGVDGLSINHRAMRTATVRRYQQLGLEVAVWTISSPDVRRRLRRSPLDYVIVDRP